MIYNATARLFRALKTPQISAAIKAFFPKGLRGRTLIILLFPVIMTQLVIAGVFIQRHHDRVTRQMVANIEPRIRLVLSRISSASSIEEAYELITPITVPGNLQVEIGVEGKGPENDLRLFYDFSGAVVIDAIKNAIPSVETIDLLSFDGNLLTIRARTTLGETVISAPRSSVTPAKSHQLLVLMVFTGIFLTAISFAFLRNQLKPIIRLANASKAFGQGEHIELHPTGATEVREATQAFLDMRERIRNHINQRTQMLYNISHDLKTPLARIRVGLELLESSQEINDLINDVNHMSLMVKEFLEYSQNQNLETITNVKAKSLIDEIIKDAQFPSRKLSLNVDSSVNEEISLTVQPIRTRRAVQNLVQNAFSYGNKIQLSVRVSNNMLCFIVEDDGPGIPEEKLEMAMRPFTRLDSARNLSEGSGVGLGLAIAKDIATGHGGNLTLKVSKDLGGLEATLSLPITKEAYSISETEDDNSNSNDS